MSLVITSNTPNNDIQETTAGINKAFSYTNHLQGTLKIPAQSQIAVQSVKLNKDGNAMLNKYNSKFGFYFGRPQSIYLQNVRNPIDVANNSFMIPAFILPEEDRERNLSLNTDDLAAQIQKSFKKVLNCPNLCETTSSAINPGPLVTPIRNASQQGFTGFDWKITHTPSASSTSISTTWTNFLELGGAAPTVIDLIIINPDATEEISVVGTQYPLNLANGKFKLNFGTHNNDGTYEEFSVGLSRCNGSALASSQSPPYWEGTRGTALVSNIFFDWRIASVVNAAGNHEVRVFQSVFDPDTQQFCEVEFEYWNNKAGPRRPFNGDGGTGGLIFEDEEFETVEFSISNERIKIVLDGDGGDKTITTGVQGGGDAGGDQTMKPSGPTTRWIFPKLILAPGKNMVISNFSGVDVKDYVYGKCQDLDWYNERVCDGDILEAEILDSSLVYGYLGSDAAVTVSPLFYNQQGLAGFGNMGCESRIVTAPTPLYFAARVGLNSQYIFGFRNNTDALPITGGLPAGGLITNFQSSSVPSLVSKESIFIRLKNFPITSANFSKAAMSNILYHVPTFSNSGQETGALHFEPSQMVYLDINNTEDLFISTMEVDLVYGDETLALGLAGKTTVIFHIRSAR